MLYLHSFENTEFLVFRRRRLGVFEYLLHDFCAVLQHLQHARRDQFGQMFKGKLHYLGSERKVLDRESVMCVGVQEIRPL